MMFIVDKISVVVVFLQIILCITSMSVDRGSPLSQSSTASTPISTSNVTKSNINNGVVKDAAVPMEGGGNTSAPRTHGREHEIEGPALPVNNVKVNDSSLNATPVSKSLSSTSTTTTTTTTTTTSTTTTTERSVSISEIPILSTNGDHKKIAARKGVNFTDFMNAQKTINATTPKPKPNKPTLTIASDEEPYAPSHFQSNTKTNSSATQTSIPNVPLQVFDENQGKSQQYVLPIVIVILSVPFVAILISFLYKRGAEWWKYRHYRRMDFLINGMYDN